MPTTPKLYSRVVAITDSHKREDGSHEITIAANGIARDNIDLDLDTLDTANYLRNPVVMPAHERGMLPIGRTLEIKRGDKGQLRARFEFLPNDLEADRWRNAWDLGFIRAASVSWMPGAVSETKDGRWRHTDSELLEWSLVSVPADPDALRSAARKLGIPEGVLVRQGASDDTHEALEQRVTALEAAMEAASNGANAVPLAESNNGDDPASEDIEAAGRVLADWLAELKRDTK